MILPIASAGVVILIIVVVLVVLVALVVALQFPELRRYMKIRKM